MVSLDITGFDGQKFLNIWSGGAGEFHPHAPTDPYVNLSIHTAPLIQPIDNNQPSTSSYMNGSSHFWLTI